MTRTLRITIAAVLAGGIFAGTAMAQGNPEDGAVWVPPPDDTVEQPPPVQAQGTQPSYQGQPPPPQPPPPQPPPPQQQPAQPVSDGRSDHTRVVGRLAVGFMGVSMVPVGSLTSGTGSDLLSAPALGARYWVGDMVGVDVGIGLGYTGGSIDNGIDTFPLDNAFAMTIHGGVPLALVHAGHFTLLLVPEINIGFATGTIFGGTPDEDRGRSGFLFQIGGRIGTEIHFGFMNIPQLSLQASVGLYFEYLSAGVGGNRAGARSASIDAYSLSTSVQGEPWDILLGALTALYYF